MKLFLLFISFLFNVSTWALDDLAPALTSPCKKRCIYTYHTECGLMKECPEDYHYWKTEKAHCFLWDNRYVCRKWGWCPC